MTTFKSSEINLQASASNVFGRLSNLENLQSFLNNIPQDKIPADKMEQFRNMRITPDSISIPGGPVGEVTLNVVERTPDSLIKLKAANVPVDIFLSMCIKEVSDNSCAATVMIDADIPVMLKPMVSGPLQKIVDQFAMVLAAIPFGNNA